MDLGHQRRVDQARFGVQLIVVPVGVLCASRSQMWLCSSVNSVWSMARPIHQLSVNPLKSMPGVRVDGSSPVGSICSLPPIAVRSFAAVFAIAAVDLRAVPPVTVHVGVGGRPRGARRRRSGTDCGTVMLGAPQSSPGASGMSIVFGRRALVDEPVVHHELDPRGRQQVEDRRGLELVARHQLAADHARVRE